MIAKSAPKHKNLLNRNGRYWARLSVPEVLRPIIMKRELLEGLGPDLMLARRRLPGAIARMQERLSEAREQLRAERRPASPPPRKGRVLSLGNLAKAHFESELTKYDAERRADLSRFADTFHLLNETVRPFLAEELRKVVSGLPSRHCGGWSPTTQPICNHSIFGIPSGPVREPWCPFPFQSGCY
jgi:hypothetical protein